MYMCICRYVYMYLYTYVYAHPYRQQTNETRHAPAIQPGRTSCIDLSDLPAWSASSDSETCLEIQPDVHLASDMSHNTIHTELPDLFHRDPSFRWVLVKILGCTTS